MTETVQTIADRTAVVLDIDGPTLDAAMLANDLIGMTWQHEADLLIVPTSRLPHDFFVLRTGVLGEAAQKLTNYHVQMAVVGDVFAIYGCQFGVRGFSQGNQCRWHALVRAGYERA